jgi:hypothetical protein
VVAIARYLASADAIMLYASAGEISAASGTTPATDRPEEAAPEDPDDRSPVALTATLRCLLPAARLPPDNEPESTLKPRARQN